MARRYGRSPRGRRLAAPVPHRHWKTSTLVAGLRDDSIVAPLVIDHAMNSVTFRAYVEQLLAPTLAPGDIVSATTCSAIRRQACGPPSRHAGQNYATCRPTRPTIWGSAPNPIEQVFAKLKALVRAKPPRNLEDLWHTIGDCLGRLTTAECSNYLANSGYPRLM